MICCKRYCSYNKYKMRITNVDPNEKCLPSCSTYCCKMVYIQKPKRKPKPKPPCPTGCSAFCNRIKYKPVQKKTCCPVHPKPRCHKRRIPRCPEKAYYVTIPVCCIRC